MAGKAKAAKEESVVEGDNESLINEVIEKVSKLYKKNEELSYYETGELILAKIYEIENPEKYEWTLDDLKKKKKSKIFRKLQATIASKSNDGVDLPKKTFFYNALNLVKEKQMLKGNEHYESLSMVNRIALISVKDAKLKADLIEEIANGGLSSRKAKELILERKGQAKEKSPILEYINNPQEKELPSDSEIENLSEEEIKAFAERANKRIEDLTQKIANQVESKKLLDEFIEKLRGPGSKISEKTIESEAVTEG